MAEIVTEETTPETYRFTTASEATCDVTVSEGLDSELRTKNTIHAQNQTEDIVKGYSITLKDSLFLPEVFALIDGGTLTYAGEEGEKLAEYTGPVMGQAVSRKPFTLNLYTEEKDTNGDTLSYFKWPFKHCKGSPVKPSFKDGEFFTPEYTMESRPKNGESALSIIQLKSLPAD